MPCSRGGVLSQHALQQGVVWSRGVPGPGSLLPEGCLVWRGSAPRWGVPGLELGGSALVGSAPGGVETPRTATAAGGTHPTGMHSCFTGESPEVNVYVWLAVSPLAVLLVVAAVYSIYKIIR